MLSGNRGFNHTDYIQLHTLQKIKGCSLNIPPVAETIPSPHCPELSPRLTRSPVLQLPCLPGLIFKNERSQSYLLNNRVRISNFRSCNCSNRNNGPITESDLSTLMTETGGMERAPSQCRYCCFSRPCCNRYWLVSAVALGKPHPTGLPLLGFAFSTLYSNIIDSICQEKFTL